MDILGYYTLVPAPASQPFFAWGGIQPIAFAVPGNARWDGSATITFTGGQTMQRMVLIQGWAAGYRPAP